MEINDVIHIRDTFKKIKVKLKKINRSTQEEYEQEVSVPLLITLDNEVHIYESKMSVLWDDSHGVLWYYAYNTTPNSEMAMMGSSKINMPAMLCAADYGEIQQIKVFLNEDTLVKSLDILAPDVKIYNTETPETLNDDIPNVMYRGRQAKRKDIVYSKFCEDTNPQTDYDMHRKINYNK